MRHRPIPLTIPIGALICAITLAIGTLVYVNHEPPPVTRLMQAEIVHVLNDRAFVQPRTVIQLEDGTRRQIPYYLGEPGETFVLAVEGP